MKRSRSITLVLLGGGIVLGLGGCGETARERECRLAREQMRPDAAQICARSQARSSTGGGYYGSWFTGRSAGAGNTAFAGGDARAGTVSRGGFGATGARASSGG